MEPLHKLKRDELKRIALENGLKGSFNGRTISKMRKTDFLDFIVSLRTPPATVSNQRTPNAPRRDPSAPFIRILFPHLLDTTRRRLFPPISDILSDDDDDLDIRPLLLSMIVRGDEPEEEQREPYVGKISEEDKDDEEEAHEHIRCVVCLHNKVSILFRNCKHLVTCDRCCKQLKKCPKCNDPLKKEDLEKIFLP